MNCRCFVGAKIHQAELVLLRSAPLEAKAGFHGVADMFEPMASLIALRISSTSVVMLTAKTGTPLLMPKIHGPRGNFATLRRVTSGFFAATVHLCSDKVEAAANIRDTGGDPDACVDDIPRYGIHPVRSQPSTMSPRR